MNAHLRRHIATRIALAFALLLASATTALGQGTTFTYQGRLTDTGMPASNIYEMEFRLFDSLAGGTQQGATITNSAVQVTNGVFTLQLDFGDQFDGNSRYLEIAIRPLGSPDPFVVLSPRQPVACSPYAIKSATAGSADTAATATNATQLGGMPASGFIQNTTTQQSATNFNISGTGSAGIINAESEYRIGNTRVMKATDFSLFVGANTGPVNTGLDNSFFGHYAGYSNTTGSSNSFFGSQAGYSNTTGNENSFFGLAAGGQNTGGNWNSFFGHVAGNQNTTGAANSFFGWLAGYANTTGSENSFFGASAGVANTTGSFGAFFGNSAGSSNTGGLANSFFGYKAGNKNTTGSQNSSFGFSAGYKNTGGFGNSFFGFQTGNENTTGAQNSFFGNSAGYSNTTGMRNTFIGMGAGDTNTSEYDNTIIGFVADLSAGIINATAVGSRAYVTQSNSLVLGSINGVNGATASAKVGIGTTSPIRTLDVRDGNEGSIQVGPPDSNGNPKLIYFGDGNFVSIGESFADDYMYLRAGRFRFQDGDLEPHVDAYQKLGSSSHRWLVVYAANGTIQTSDARLKQSITDLGYGLSELMRLRPVSFLWKDRSDGRRHLGLLAQEVELVLPELIHKSDDPSAPLGLNYSDLVPLLVKSTQQQQAQISQYEAKLRQQQQQINQQQAQIKLQQSQLDGLKKLVCKVHSDADVCK